MPPVDLGSRLRTARGIRKMSLREAAEAAKISAAYLQKLEHGDVKSPSPHVLHALAEVLKIPYSTVMQLAGYVVPSGSDGRVNVLAHALSSAELTEDEADALANYLAWYRHDKASR
ncbi:MAG: helix-turn-helix transcriptional regulator [Actinobacteria bacterium]|nr:helix-turn-helix transcriptional regulator [Actinomycetota bacterium]